MISKNQQGLDGSINILVAAELTRLNPSILPLAHYLP